MLKKIETAVYQMFAKDGDKQPLLTISYDPVNTQLAVLQGPDGGMVLLTGANLTLANVKTITEIFQDVCTKVSAAPKAKPKAKAPTRAPARKPVAKKVTPNPEPAKASEVSAS